MNDRPTASSGPPAPEPDRHPDLYALYAATRDAQPPEAIDDRLRAAARRAVGSGPMRRPRRSPWLPPLALAATVLLGVGVAWQVEREQPADPVVAVAPAPAPQAERAASVSDHVAVPSSPRADTPDMQADTQAATPAPRRQSFGRAPAPATKPADEASSAAQSAPAESVASAPSMRNESAPEAAIASRPLAAPAPATASADNAAAQPSPPSAPAIAADAGSGAPAASMQEKREATTTARKSLRARSDGLAREAQTEAPEEEARLTVPEWIARIRAHRTAGREAEARAMLERFVRLHPDHTLPPDLRALRH
jgi:hypothetical protein